MAPLELVNRGERGEGSGSGLTMARIVADAQKDKSLMLVCQRNGLF